MRTRESTAVAERRHHSRPEDRVVHQAFREAGVPAAGATLSEASTVTVSSSR
jgi:hypothetical protein